MLVIFLLLLFNFTELDIAGWRKRERVQPIFSQYFPKFGMPVVSYELCT
jgi:hypothetical protein